MPRLALVFAAALLALPASAQKAQASGTPSDPRVERALDAQGVTYSVEPNGDYRMLYTVSDDRTQLVWVRPLVYGEGSVDTREVFSYAMTLEPTDTLPAATVNDLLRRNDGYSVGAWGRSDTRLIFSARVAANASPEVLTNTIELVLNTADQVELELTGTDDW